MNELALCALGCVKMRLCKTADMQMLVKCYDNKMVQLLSRLTIIYLWFPLGSRPTKQKKTLSW